MTSKVWPARMVLRLIQTASKELSRSCVAVKTFHSTHQSCVCRKAIPNTHEHIVQDKLGLLMVYACRNLSDVKQLVVVVFSNRLLSRKP